MFSKEEKETLLRALWYRENEGLADDADMALIKRLQETDERIDENSELSIYTLDIGWRGAIAVLAHDEDEAKDLIFKSGICVQEDLSRVQNASIELGVFLENFGDQ